ncbi:ATP-binding cassette domain-containing protein [Gordonia defluvii]|uniref:ATP-binding cassette domain-containing protein n=1 Tax=Gordonia defluvii TaxID=283718 RepID=A0ABP6L477_9ACTN|nr:ATP-binding cassette domain-containing protein [Gordonia sp. UBA5067]
MSLCAHDLTKRYGGRTVLRGVSAVVPDGSLTYLLGLNGAGKSTLLRCMSGIATPDHGTVGIDGPTLGTRVNGQGSTRPARPGPRLRELGVHLDHDAFLPRHTGRRHLRWLGRSAGIGPGRVEEVLALVGLADVADRRIGDYSLGMRQRVGIAGALLGDPPALIFDEPFNGLDIAGIIWLRTLLRELADDGRAVLVASHLLDEVRRNADRILVLRDGELIADDKLSGFLSDAVDLESAYLRTVGAAPPAAGPGTCGAP